MQQVKAKIVGLLALMALVLFVGALRAEEPGAVGIAFNESREGAADLVEYYRYACANCKKMQSTLAEAKERFGDNVRIVLVPFGKESQPESSRAARAALAADAMGRFQDLHQVLFENQDQFTDEGLADLAELAGIDRDQFLKLYQSDAIAERLEAHNRAMIEAGVRYLPAFRIGDEKIEGWVSKRRFLKMIEKAAKSTEQTNDKPGNGFEHDWPELGDDGDSEDEPPSWPELIYAGPALKAFTAQPTLKIGDKAPNFTLPSVQGDQVSLADYRGQIVVLSFVPAAWTPVCSGQWLQYVESYDRFKALNTTVIGVTTDNIPTLYAWTRGFGELQFPVLSDFWPHGKVCEQYGVLRPESGQAERATFVIDPEGIIREIVMTDINKEPSFDALVKILEKLNAQ